MTYTEKLNLRIAATRSCLCVGLDPRPELHPGGELKSFLQRVITETLPFAACYKPNAAYFESMGSAGVRLLEEVRGMIPEDVPLLLDAKRSDIGETQKYYAKAAFDALGADAITLNPFLGYDSIEPFLDRAGKGLYLLAVTSNAGAADIELQRLADGRPVYALVQDIARRAAGSPAEVGYVLGLTNAATDVLSQIDDRPLLIPGLGAQGGELTALSGTGRKAPPLINVSRGILYGPQGSAPGDLARDYAEKIRSALGMG